MFAPLLPKPTPAAPSTPCLECMQGSCGTTTCDPIMAAIGSRYRQAPGLASWSVIELEELVAHLDGIIAESD
jgi:hypothetical protein